MTTQDLIAGYAAYTDADQLGHAGDAPAITPTTTATPSSAACVASLSVSVDSTFDHGC